MPTTTARGLVVPNLTGDGADLHQMFLDLANSIEAMMNSPLVLGSSLSVPSDVISTAGAFESRAAGFQYSLFDASAGADLKRSRLKAGAGVTSLVSETDLAAQRKVGLTMDHATGKVTLPNGLAGPRVDSPYFRAYRSSAVSYATGATVAFNTETDPNGWYDNTTGIFLPTVAGMYRVSWLVSLVTAMTVNKVAQAFLIASGAGTSSAPPAFQVTTGYALGTGASALVAMNGTTDSLHVRLDHDNGGTVAVSPFLADTHFEAERIGA